MTPGAAPAPRCCRWAGGPLSGCSLPPVLHPQLVVAFPVPKEVGAGPRTSASPAWFLQLAGPRVSCSQGSSLSASLVSRAVAEGSDGRELSRGSCCGGTTWQWEGAALRCSLILQSSRRLAGGRVRLALGVWPAAAAQPLPLCELTQCVEGWDGGRAGPEGVACGCCQPLLLLLCPCPVMLHVLQLV